MFFVQLFHFCDYLAEDFCNYVLGLLCFSIYTYYIIYIVFSARVAELADALDLGSSTARCTGSSPVSRTIYS